MNVINAVAEFERDLLIERTQAGLSRAKAEGKTLGRPPSLTDDQRRAVERRLDRASFFGETQVVDFARVSRRSRVRYWVRSGLIPSRAKALVWSGVGRA